MNLGVPDRKGHTMTKDAPTRFPRRDRPQHQDSDESARAPIEAAIASNANVFEFNNLVRQYLLEQFEQATKVVLGDPLFVRIDPTDEDPEESFPVDPKGLPIRVKARKDAALKARPDDFAGKVTDRAARRRARHIAHCIREATQSSNGEEPSRLLSITLPPARLIRVRTEDDGKDLTFRLAYEGPTEVEVVRLGAATRKKDFPI